MGDYVYSVKPSNQLARLLADTCEKKVNIKMTKPDRGQTTVLGEKLAIFQQYYTVILL